MVAAGLALAACDARNADDHPDAGVPVVGTMLAPAQAWSVRVTEIDFRGDARSLPGFDLQAPYSVCPGPLYTVDNAFPNVLDDFAALSTARYPSLDLSVLARDALTCDASTGDCAPLRWIAHANVTGATWVQEEGAGVLWGPVSGWAGAPFNAAPDGDATLEIPALAESGAVVVLPIRLRDVRMGVRLLDVEVEYIEFMVGGIMDQAGLIALTSALKELGAAGALLDNPGSLFASVADVSLAAGACNHDGLSVGFVLRATEPLGAAP